MARFAFGEGDLSVLIRPMSSLPLKLYTSDTSVIYSKDMFGLRPCFLVIDREHSVSISTRKLVIETAKFNVITAYSGAEAVRAFKKFPNVDGIVVDAGLKDISCSDLISEIRQLRSDVPVIVVGNTERHPCSDATHRLEGFNPKKILGFLQQLYPSETAEISSRENELEEKELMAGVE